MRGYRMAKSARGKEPVSGPEASRKEYGPEYETSDLGDRLTRQEFYERVKKTTPKRKFSLSEEDEFLEGTEVVEMARKRVRDYWKKGLN